MDQWQPVSNKAELSKAIGRNLKALRRQRFPSDDQARFASRIGVARYTYQKMERGDASVAFGSYMAAAEMLGVADQFARLFSVPEQPVDLIGELDL